MLIVRLLRWYASFVVCCLLFGFFVLFFVLFVVRRGKGRGHSKQVRFDVWASL